MGKRAYGHGGILPGVSLLGLPLVRLEPVLRDQAFQKGKHLVHAGSVWIWRVPMDYFMGIGISIACAYGASLFNGNPETFATHAYVVVALVFVMVPVTALVVAPLYQRWYWYMRRKDDRDKTAIFYNFPEKPLGK